MPLVILLNSHYFAYCMSQERQRLLTLLTDLSFEKRAVTLASGKKADFYFDCKQTALHAEGHYLIGRLGLQEIQKYAPDATAVGGMTMGADPIASAISLTSFLDKNPLHAFYVRKEPKGHGTKEWLEGTKNLTPTTPVVVVEDVVTTGGSTLRAIGHIEQAGFAVAHILSIVDRLAGGTEALSEKYSYSYLFSKKDFVP